MRKEIQNLENRINELWVRRNNAEETLSLNSLNSTTEINSLRSELVKLMNEFDLLKSEMQEENLDATITEDDIHLYCDLIDDYIVKMGCRNFDSVSLTDIIEATLNIEYDNRVVCENVKIEVNDYFIKYFELDFEKFNSWLDNNESGEFKHLIKFFKADLFDLIRQIVEVGIRQINTECDFYIDDFECEINYNNEVEVISVIVDKTQLISVFLDNLDYDRKVIVGIIKDYHFELRE